MTSTHLAQRLKELIGITPKRLARTLRFAATVFAIDPLYPSTGLTSPAAQATSTRPSSATSSGRSPGSRRPSTSKSGGGSYANILATCWIAGRCRSIDFFQDRQLTKRQLGGTPSRGGTRWAK